MTIHSELLNSVLAITIEREEVLNALDIPHLEQLIFEMDRALTDTEIRSVLIGGKGRAFCVGADIKAMDVMTDEEFSRAAGLYQDLCRQTINLDKPIIAAVNGYALGGGLELAMMADIRIAGYSAKLGLPDAELGFSPTGGLTFILNQVVGAGWAMHLAMTAEILDAERALQIGLVTSVVEDNMLERSARSLAEKMAQFPPTGMKNIKRLFNLARESDLETILDLEEKFDSECYRSVETRQALRNFMASRKK